LEGKEFDQLLKLDGKLLAKAMASNEGSSLTSIMTELWSGVMTSSVMVVMQESQVEVTPLFEEFKPSNIPISFIAF
jgi:hypothetical protein